MITLKWLALCSNTKDPESFVDNIFKLVIKVVSLSVKKNRQTDLKKKKSLEAGISHTGDQ